MNLGHSMSNRQEVEANPVNSRAAGRRAAWALGVACGVLCAAAQAIPSAQGTGETEELARENARTELARFLKVDVRSEVGRYADGSGKRSEYVQSAVSTNLVLLGVGFRCEQLGRKEHSCVATFDEAAARKLYPAAIAEGTGRLAAGLKALDAAPPAEHLQRIDALLTDLQSVEGMLLVYRFLLDAEPPALPVTRQDLQGRVGRLQDELPTLALAASNLASQLDSDGIYFIVPPKLQGSEEVTPFARALADAAATQFRTVPSLRSANRLLVGRYEVAEKNIRVTWQVQRGNGVVERTVTQKLARTAADGLRLEPMSAGLDQLLQTGLLVKGDLRAEIATGSGALDGQSFVGGDRLKLMVKLNKPGYLYMVGHVTPTGGDAYSYLVQMNDLPADTSLDSASARRAFVRTIAADEANKWVEIGEFDVTAPFGVERLQLFASSGDLVDRLPAVRQQADGLARVAGEPQAVVQKTRALQRVKPKEESVEATFTYTTLPSAQAAAR